MSERVRVQHRRPSLHARIPLVALLASVIVVAACATSTAIPPVTTTPPGTAPSDVSGTTAPGTVAPRPGSGPGVVNGVKRATVVIVKRIPKDPAGFTQGLEVSGNTIYESVGLYGQSEMRTVNLKTGEVTRRAKLDAKLFAEGATRLPNGSIVQLTWQEKAAIVRDPKTLAETKRFSYEQEGWGICYSAKQKALFHSDGSSTLFVRDPKTFAVTSKVTVRDPRGIPTTELNELECIGGSVYANVWMQNRILEIDAKTGTVLREIDATALVDLVPNRTADDVLNGIAKLSNGNLLLTGKRWPEYFEVRVVNS